MTYGLNIYMTGRVTQKKKTNHFVKNYTYEANSLVARITPSFNVVAPCRVVYSKLTIFFNGWLFHPQYKLNNKKI